MVFAEDLNARKGETELSEVQQQLTLELEVKQKLADKVEALYAEMESTRQQLVATAAQIRLNETDLRDLESRIDTLENSKASMEAKLIKDRSAIGRLIVTLERIRRAPPEAMLARPETPFKTAQGALLMRQLIPALERHTKTLKNNLETLGNVAADLQIEKENHLKVSQSLSAQHQTLSSLMQAREMIYKQTAQDYQQREANIQDISRKAQDLEELVGKLKQEEVEQREKLEAQRKESNRKRQEEAELAAMTLKVQERYATAKPEGEPQLPVSGHIKVGYKQKDDLGASSNGLTLEGRGGGVVVAPLSGKVQFAGPFKKYGNIVIIEHEGGFHSLVAGLEKIDTLVGTYVESGEPIGSLPDLSSSGAAPKLYYELRRNGKPVNPSLKFSGLG